MSATAEVEFEVKQNGEQPKAPLTRYSPSDAAIAEAREKFAGLTFDTPKNYDAGTKALAVLRSWRTGIEKVRVAANADALAWQRNNNAEAKRLTLQIEEIERPLKEAKQAIDDEKERKK